MILITMHYNECRLFSAFRHIELLKVGEIREIQFLPVSVSRLHEALSNRSPVKMLITWHLNLRFASLSSTLEMSSSPVESTLYLR